ncbi:MAG: hypothetical protein HHJ09_12505 [Glaciimonas sp.]|nr:hypothetical protein [Glaciimonas sp.]
MNKPIAPADGECCENSCDPCVWDTYYAALRAWEEQQTAPTAAAAAAAHNASANINAPT